MLQVSLLSSSSKFTVVAKMGEFRRVLLEISERLLVQPEYDALLCICLPLQFLTLQQLLSQLSCSGLSDRNLGNRT